MNLNGKAWIFGNDVNTDEIIPARYLNTIDPKFLASHCMEDARADFPKIAGLGDIIVAGKNFGCGSSREHAPICIKALGISCVIAVSFARIFYRNSFNIGLPIFEMKSTSKIKEGDILEVNSVNGEIINVTKKETYKVAPIPKFMQELIECGGLLEYARIMTNPKR